MATHALQLMPDGSKKRVYARDLNEEDKHQRFFCEGTCLFGPYRGQSCGTELRPVFCTDKENYFSTVKTTKHKKGCEFCEESKEKRIQVLGRSCQGKTDVDILSSLMEHPKGMRKNETMGAAQRRNERLNRRDDEEDGDDGDEDLTIKKKFRPPKDAGELYDLLTAYSLDDAFAQKPVAEWIVDQRTFSHYYADGIRTNQIAFVIMAKTSPSNLPDELKGWNNHYYIFLCSLGNRTERMYFMLPRNDYVAQNIVYTSSIKQFGVVAAWHRAETTARAYFCEDAPGKKQIVISPNLTSD